MKVRTTTGISFDMEKGVWKKGNGKGGSRIPRPEIENHSLVRTLG